MVVPGAGIAERNTVLGIMTRLQGNVWPMQKTIIMPYVVGLKKGSRKRSIVLEGIRVIVVDAGEPWRQLDAGEPWRQLDAGKPWRQLDAGEPWRQLDAGKPWRQLDAGRSLVGRW